MADSCNNIPIKIRCYIKKFTSLFSVGQNMPKHTVALRTLAGICVYRSRLNVDCVRALAVGYAAVNVKVPHNTTHIPSNEIVHPYTYPEIG